VSKCGGGITYRRRGVPATAELGRGGGIRALAALVWMGCKGEARAPICRAAANLGGRARAWKAGERLGGDRGVQLREVDGEPDRWGRPVSGWASARGERWPADVRVRWSAG
jgi:hypothetical protein